MAYLRIACDRELAQIRTDGRLPKNYEAFPPYPAGSITCVLEDPIDEPTLRSYFKAIAEQRELVPGSRLHLLVIAGLDTTRIQNDGSAHGWPESRVYLGDIPSQNVRLAAEVILGGTSMDYLVIPPVVRFPQPQPL